MFNPKTEKIKKIYQSNKVVAEKLKKLFDGKVCMYIDYANIRPWANKLKWHIQVTRLKQFLDSFDNIENIKFYQGTLEGDQKSEKEIEKLRKNKFELRTKSVKIMNPQRLDRVFRRYLCGYIFCVRSVIQANFASLICLYSIASLENKIIN